MSKRDATASRPGRTLLGLPEGRRKPVVEADGSLGLPWGRVAFAVDGAPLGSDGPVVQKLYHGSKPAVVSQDVHGVTAASVLAFTGRTPWGPCDFVRIRLRVDRGDERVVRFAATCDGFGEPEGPAAVVAAEAPGRRRVVALGLGADAAWTTAAAGNGARLELAAPVSPAAPAEAWMVLPWKAWTGDVPGLARLDGDEALEAVEEAWDAALAQGARLELPDEAVLDRTRFALTQGFLLLDRDAEGVLPAAGPEPSRRFRLEDGAAVTTALSGFGYADDARAILATLLKRQRPDGRFETADGGFDGLGQAVWTLTEHFLLTRDLGWLRSIWPSLNQATLWLAEARRAARGGGGVPDGLLPPPPDGGPADRRLGRALAMNAWGVFACRRTLEVSAYLGQDVTWLEAEVDEYREAVGGCLDRVLAGPLHGAEYLAAVAPLGFPCDVLPRSDGRWRAILDRAASSLAGATPGTAAAIGHLRLRRGDGDGAATALDGLARMASDTLGWAEDVAGGGPSGQAAASYLLLLRALLVSEEGPTLHLFPGVPRTWAASGSRIDVKRLPTGFGPLETSIKTEGTETYAGIVLAQGREPERLVLHLRYPEPRRIVKCGLHGICDDERIEGEQLIVDRPKGTLFVTMSHERAR